MEIYQNNADKIYEKAKKIRIVLLLFTDKDIKRKMEKDNNKRYIKQYNPKNQDMFEVSFQECFTNNNSQIVEISSFSDKEKCFSSINNFFSFRNKSNTSQNTSSNSYLQTMEESFKKKMTISKLIIHKKVIPENIIHLLEINNKILKQHSISTYTNSIFRNNSSNKDVYSKYDKEQLYLENLCDSFKSKYS